MATDYAKTMQDLSPYEYYPFATYMGKRTGGPWKRHKTLGHAKNSIANAGHYQGRMAVYGWDEDTKSWIGVDA